MAGGCEGLGVLLAFGDEHDGGRVGGGELRETEQHPSHVSELPDVTTAAVRASLAEVFGVETDHLEEQLAELVAVGVLGDHPARL